MKKNPIPEVSDYIVTYDNVKTEYESNVPVEVKSLISNFHELLKNEPANLVKKLEQCKDKYGPLPVLYDYLGTAYEKTGDPSTAEYYIIENHKNNPGYLIAKLNYANKLITKGKLKEIAEIFDNKFELKLLYPDRKKFNIKEFIMFYAIMAVYFYRIDDIEASNQYYEVLKQTAPDNPITKQVTEKVRPSFFKRAVYRLTRLTKKSGKTPQ